MRTYDKEVVFDLEERQKPIPITGLPAAPNFSNIKNQNNSRPSAMPALKKADLLVFTCVFIWAFNIPLVKICLQYFEPLEISLIRFGSAGVLFAIYVRLREGSLRVERRHLPLLLLSGLIGITLNQILFVYALSNTTSSEVSLLMAATPSLATFLAWALGQEKIRLNYWLSLPLALGGVTLIILTAPGARLAGNLLGDALAVMTAGSWATYTVIMRPLFSHYSAARISAWVLLIGSAALLPLGFTQINLSRMGSVPSEIWLALLYTTLGAVLVTNILWYTGIKELGGPRTAYYSYLQPFVGVFASFLILSETIVIWQIAGGLLIVASMVLYRVRLGNRSKSTA